MLKALKRLCSALWGAKAIDERCAEHLMPEEAESPGEPTGAEHAKPCDQSPASAASSTTGCQSRCSSIGSHGVVGDNVIINEADVLPRLLKLAHFEQADEAARGLVSQGIGLLRQCGYHIEDVCLVLAYASAYFDEFYAERSSDDLRSCEASHILCLLMYIGHSYVLDETCSIHIWHKRLFQHYCSLKVLDKAVMSIVAMRSYKLRVEDDALQRRYVSLLAAAGALHASCGCRLHSERQPK